MKWDLFHNFILFCSNNVFFINRSLKFNYKPCCLKGKILYNEDFFYIYRSPSVVRTMQVQNFGWKSCGLAVEEGNGQPTSKCILKDRS